MGSDVFFRMGSTHAICQDYAIAGAHRGAPFAILSDGCSGGKPDGEQQVPVELEPGAPFTDFGSRFLVRAAQLCLEERLGFDYVETLRSAERMATAARLPFPSLDATLLFAHRQDGKIKVYQSGDGVVATRHRHTKQIEYTTLKFDENAPFYLNYFRSSSNMRKYLSLVKKYTITTGARITEGSWTQEEIDVEVQQDFPIKEMTFGPEYDLVLLMSDGAESFQTTSNKEVPLTDVLEQVMAFKVMEGEFITRRCDKFLRKFCVEKGWKHNDDFSVAGIYIPEEDVQP